MMKKIMEQHLLILVEVLRQFQFSEKIDLCRPAVIPVGGDHITKDLSIILKTPTEQARKIKHQYGHAFYDDASDDELI